MRGDRGIIVRINIDIQKYPGSVNRAELIIELGDLGSVSVIMDLIHYLFAPLILFCVPYTLDLLP